MNIAVFGWYHHQNAGDDRIQRCLTRWLDSHTLAFLPAGRPPPLALLRTYDAAILGGGGLARKRGAMFGGMRRWIRSAGIPVALAGISLEGEDDGLVRELRGALDVCAFAWWRDRGSLEQVGAHPRAFVAPDITWLYPFDPAPAGRGVAIGLRRQGPLARAAWRQALAAIDEPLRPWPLYFENGGDRALASELMPGCPVPNCFTLAPARDAEAVVTGRFHGLLFALQLGRPVLTVSSLPKVRRFLAEHGLDAWRVDEDRPQDLVRLWPAFRAAWPALAERARSLRQTLSSEVSEMAGAARSRLLGQAAALPPPSRRVRDRLRRVLDLGRWL